MEELAEKILINNPITLNQKDKKNIHKYLNNIMYDYREQKIEQNIITA